MIPGQLNANRCACHSMTKGFVRYSKVMFAAWRQAEPGEALEYHRGFLGVDRTPSLKDRLDLIAMAERAMRLAEQGLIHLVQRRLGDDTFSYLAFAALAVWPLVH
jgi:hypothetical protein